MAHNGSGVAGIIAQRAHSSRSYVRSGLTSGPGGPKAGYTAWWDASQIAGVADGAALNTWPDLSGGGYNAGFSGSSQPTFWKTTPAHLQNGKPTVTFNGTTQYLFKNPGIAGPLNTSLVQAVCATTAPAATGYLFVINNGCDVLVTGGHWQGDNFSTAITGGTTDTAMHVVTAYLPPSGSTGVVRVDRATVAGPGSTPSSGGGGFFVIGANSGNTIFWTGTICELIYYRTFTGTVADYQANENYLRTKWGTP